MVFSSLTRSHSRSFFLYNGLYSSSLSIVKRSRQMGGLNPQNVVGIDEYCSLVFGGKEVTVGLFRGESCNRRRVSSTLYSTQTTPPQAAKHREKEKNLVEIDKLLVQKLLDLNHCYQWYVLPEIGKTAYQLVKCGKFTFLLWVSHGWQGMLWKQQRSECSEWNVKSI